MSDYISREEALMAVTRAKLPDTTPDGVPIANGKRSVTDCVRRIKDIPAADVVPVVRCKDCKHWELSKIAPSFYVCTYVCGATFVRNADDFCSRGEKREEG